WISYSSYKNSLWSELRCTVSLLVYITAVTFLLAFLPGIPPHYDFKPLRVAGPKPLVGKLAPKCILDKAEILIEGQFVGPESLFLEGNVLYTGVESSEVVKVEDKGDGADVKFLGSTGVPCAFELKNIHRGIIAFDLKTGTTEPYLTGPVQTFADDLDIAKDGTVYYSILSDTPEADMLKQVLHPNGKLMKYDPKTKEITVLLNNISFANGVQLSDNEDFVLVNESPYGRTMRYYLKGPKAGTSDIFVDGLPGLPDNIRPNGRGGYYIALFSGRMPLVDWVGRYRILHRIVGRMQWILSKVVTFVKTNIVGGPFMDILDAAITHFGPLGIGWSDKATIVEVDGNGNILAVLRAKEKNMIAVTQITVGDKFSYIGSYSENKIWKIKTTDLRNY
ncbi:unnamed protein product, partial [Allacma fusca]